MSTPPATSADIPTPSKTPLLQDDNINCMSTLSRNFHKDYVSANSLRATMLVVSFIFKRNFPSGIAEPNSDYAGYKQHKQRRRWVQPRKEIQRARSFRKNRRSSVLHVTVPKDYIFPFTYNPLFLPYSLLSTYLVYYIDLFKIFT